jgi:threonine/homoserine/homoserine lactone efflux protein
LVPGPLLTVTISESAKKGFWVGPKMIAGHAILEIALLILLLSGFGPFLNNNIIIGIIGIFGTIVLSFISVGMFLSVKKINEESLFGTNKKDEKKFSNDIIAGIIMSIANPFWTIWWLTIGLGYISFSQEFGFKGIAFFFTGHILADFLWYSVVSFLISNFLISEKRKMLSIQIYKIIMIVCGVVLTAFSAWFGYTGIARLANI